MKAKTIRILVLSSIGFLLTGCVSMSGGGGKKTRTSKESSEPATDQPTNTDNPSVTTSDSDYVNQYYAAVNDSMTGDQLKNTLYNIIHPAKATSTYDAIWNNYLLYSDVSHPEYSTKDGYRASDDIMAFYRGTVGKRSDMNKEHVWPNSRGGNEIEGDPHMVRPTLVSDNSSRGNSFYVEGKATEHDGWDPAADGMTESYRGDCARIIFYCAVQEKDKLTLIDAETDSTSNKTMGKLSDLLKWNLNYPVDEREVRRNEILNGRITSYGKTFNLNRNPFIDHPEYACRIWGDTNATTRQICNL